MGTEKRGCATSLHVQRDRKAIGMGTKFGTLAATCRTNMGVGSFPLGRFLPGSSLCGLSVATRTQNGKFSFLGQRAGLRTRTRLRGLRFKRLSFNKVGLGTLLGGNGNRFTFHDSGPLLGVSSGVRALLGHQRASVAFDMSLQDVSLCTLRMAPGPFGVNVYLRVSKGAGLRSARTLRKRISSVSLVAGSSMFQPGSLCLGLLTRPSAACTSVSTKSFGLCFSKKSKCRGLLGGASLFVTLLGQRIRRHHLSRSSVQLFLPRVAISIASNRSGPVDDCLTALNCGFGSFELRLGTGPQVKLGKKKCTCTLHDKAMLLSAVRVRVCRSAANVRVST